MFLKKIIGAMLERNVRVVVPINCNVPENDDEYIQIEAAENSEAQ